MPEFHRSDNGSTLVSRGKCNPPDLIYTVVVVNLFGIRSAIVLPPVGIKGGGDVSLTCCQAGYC